MNLEKAAGVDGVMPELLKLEGRYDIVVRESTR